MICWRVQFDQVVGLQRNKGGKFLNKPVVLRPLYPRGAGGGTPSYGLYRYVRPQRVWFLSRFGHK